MTCQVRMPLFEEMRISKFNKSFTPFHMKLTDSERAFKVIESNDISEPLIELEVFELSAMRPKQEEGFETTIKEMHE